MPELSLKLLLVDDDRDFAQLLTALLGEASSLAVTVDHVGDYENAQGAIARNEHDVCLIDFNLNSMTGTGIDLIKQASRQINSPMIMLTSCGRPATGDRAIAAGASDCLNKQMITGPLLERIIRNAVKRSARHAREQQELEALRSQLHLDRATGLCSRIAVERHLSNAMQACRQGYNGYLMYLDLNHFKPINEFYGHSAGDQTLRLVGERILKTLRDGDTAGRLGGDEFLIVGKPERADRFADQTVEKLINELRAAIEVPMELFDTDGERFKAMIGVSIGVVRYNEHDKDRDYLIALSDKARCVDRELFYRKAG